MPSVRDYQAWNRFTYILRVGKCHQTISMRTCSHETGSLTNWEQANATRPSARGPASMKQVRLLPEIRQMPQDHQQENMQLWNMFTYPLRAGIHTMISPRISSYISWNHLHPNIGGKCQWHSANDPITIIADHLPPTGRIHIFQH